jgi:hypothetical protein
LVARREKNAVKMYGICPPCELRLLSEKDGKASFVITEWGGRTNKEINFRWAVEAHKKKIFPGRSLEEIIDFFSEGHWRSV